MLNLFHYNLPPSDRTLLLIDENLRFLEIQQKSSSTAHPLLTPHTPPSSHSVHRTQRSKQPIYNWYVSPGAYFTGLALVVGSRYYVLLAWYYSRYPISPSISPFPSLLSPLHLYSRSPSSPIPPCQCVIPVLFTFFLTQAKIYSFTIHCILCTGCFDSRPMG